MRERYIPAFIMLIAATITSITNIISKVDLFTGLKRLLLVIIIFYIIGLIARTIIKKAFNERANYYTPDDEEESEEAEQTQTQEDNTENTQNTQN